MKKDRREDGPREVPSANLREVVVGMSLEIGTSLRELVISGGLKVFGQLIEDDLEQLCGERYKRGIDRQGRRHGAEEVSISFGGRKIIFAKPRVRSSKGDGELHLPVWKALTREDALGERAVEQILSGVTTRKYSRSLEGMPADVEVRGTSKSSVSRRFIAKTKAQVAAFLNRPLGDDELPIIFVDGTHLGDHVVLVALGVTKNGHKRVLGCVEGSTENSTVCKNLLRSLIDRGLKVDTHRLFVIDGSGALRKAIKGIFTKWAHIQRCQFHKEQNVLGHLPDAKQPWVKRKLREAWSMEDPAKAKKALQDLATALDEKHPCAAGSVREGLEETLTILHLRVKGALKLVVRSTNSIENLQGSIKSVTKNVKRWRGGSMALRWTVTALLEAEARFRRIRGYRDLPSLIRALENPFVETLDVTSQVA